LNLYCVNFSGFSRVCKTEGIIGTERKIGAVNNNNIKVD
jgi:hypothetical protein